MALSFLSLPPEVRVQIYGHLLIHSSSIKPQLLRAPEYYSGIQRAQRALSNLRSQPVRDFSPESAILRTCRQVYLEAMPVLYGENTFSYSCAMSIFNDEDYLKVGFPDQRLEQIKHLELKAQPGRRVEPMVPVNVAATIQYFVNRGCDLLTFKLALNQLEDYEPGDDDDKQQLLQAVALSSDVLAALVRLKVSKTLTISISYSQKRTIVEHETEGTVSDLFQDHLIKCLGSQKNFTVTNEKFFDTDFLGKDEDHEDGEDGEDDGSEDSDEWYDEDDADSYITFYCFSWCLRPQHCKAHTDNASA